MLIFRCGGTIHEKNLLKNIKGDEAIERKLGVKTKKVSKSTKRKKAIAAALAREMIEHNNMIYQQSYIEQRDIKLGGPTLVKRK